MGMRAGLIGLGLGLGLLAAGCMPAGEEVEKAGEDPRFTCDATKVQSMVGQMASQKMGGEAVRASGARTMRWIEPDSAYTMDFREDRLNIHLDAQNRVTKINCG